MPNTNFDASPSPYTIGENYFIRTVTFIYTGKLEAVYAGELVLSSAAWIADTGRFANSLSDYSGLSEIEPFPVDAQVIVARGGIIDAHINKNPLPLNQK